MSPRLLEPEDNPIIIDIRQRDDSLDLKGEINAGLRSQPPTLPSLLLWDDEGQKLFDQFSQTPSYYPFHSEIEILGRHGSDIGATAPADGALLELGCGAIRKTRSILSGYRKGNKPTHYFALDVSREGLEDSLTCLKGEFQDSPFIAITGLLGTYDDCVKWLSSLKDTSRLGSVTVLWLGNSIANLDSQEHASVFLDRFRTTCKQVCLACRFVVSTDICQRDDKVHEAYDVNRPTYNKFLLNVVGAANRVLGYDAFDPNDWKPDSWLDKRERNLHFYLTAHRDVSMQLPLRTDAGGAVTVHKGERIRCVTSGKWSEAAMDQVCRRAGFHIQHRWKDQSGDYYGCNRQLLVPECSN